MTRCPSCARANGKAPHTSASPPLLANGCASDATIRIESRGASLPQRSAVRSRTMALLRPGSSSASRPPLVRAASPGPASALPVRGARAAQLPACAVSRALSFQVSERLARVFVAWLSSSSSSSALLRTLASDSAQWLPVSSDVGVRMPEASGFRPIVHMMPSHGPTNQWARIDGDPSVQHHGRVTQSTGAAPVAPQPWWHRAWPWLALVVLVALAAAAFWRGHTEPAKSSAGADLGSLPPGVARDSAEPRHRHARYHARRSHGRLRQRRHRDAGLRSDRARGRAVRAGGVRCAADACPCTPACSPASSRPSTAFATTAGSSSAPEQLTLAESPESRRGYRTGGFIGAYVLDSKWGINQGFDTYFDKFDLSESRAISLGAIQRPGNEVVDQALPWIDQVKGRRALLRVDSPLRRALPVPPAGAVCHALQRAPVQRRNCVRRHAGRAASSTSCARWDCATGQSSW